MYQIWPTINGPQCDSPWLYFIALNQSHECSQISKIKTKQKTIKAKLAKIIDKMLELNA